MNAREKTQWMTLERIKTHFNMHERQADLLDTGLERRGMNGPAFIILHTGAALRPDGKEARRNITNAIDDQINTIEQDAQAAIAKANAWRNIKQKIERKTDDSLWRNPLWEREILNEMHKELRGIGTSSTTKRAYRKNRLAKQKFRRGFTFRDVVCIHNNEFAAFKVDRSELGLMHSPPSDWQSLFPEIEFKRKPFRWMVFPKDISGGTTIAYLQFGEMAGRLAGRGNTRRYTLQNQEWTEGDTIETWLS